MIDLQRALDWAERGRVPDFAIRRGIRALVRQRQRDLRPDDPAAAAALAERFVAGMDAAPVAPLPALANEQHYELPAELFGAILGPHRKYSCCFFRRADATLAEAEAEALQVSCERAGLENGQQVLELGCGWGSLSLWIAARYPDSRITAVSNSHSQRAYIESCAAERGLGNLSVVTCDMNAFDAGREYDRIVSVEMFEHMRNWRVLFSRVARWLRADGRCFVHVFCHRAVPYAYEDQGPGDWMSRHFFSGGMMPSDELPLRFQDELRLQARWRWDGRHYERTANAWLANMDARRALIWPILERSYGAAEAQRWWSRWRIFFMACAELWGHDSGRQWWVSHYLFSRRGHISA
ncbi:MAG: class I SAM-dependent methyltransferase [Gammaproteobacteria bacterium]|nr:class I SAM-dependent methyltransferase [Gammaproteobacteria bacterium]